MNKNILKKCADELRKEKPSIDYVIGMLETLIEMGDNNTLTVAGTSTYPYPPYVTTNQTTRTESVSDEEIIPAHLQTGPLGNNVGEDRFC